MFRIVDLLPRRKIINQLRQACAVSFEYQRSTSKTNTNIALIMDTFTTKPLALSGHEYTPKLGERHNYSRNPKPHRKGCQLRVCPLYRGCYKTPLTGAKVSLRGTGLVRYARDEESRPTA
jgi:hypothetical protein